MARWPAADRFYSEPWWLVVAWDLAVAALIVSVVAVVVVRVLA